MYFLNFKFLLKNKDFLKFSQFDASFLTMSLLRYKFGDLNWDHVFCKKKGMTSIKMSLNN